MSLSQIESLSVFGLKEDPIASINKDQQVATDQEGKCKGVLHRPCFIPQLVFGAGVAVYILYAALAPSCYRVV